MIPCMGGLRPMCSVKHAQSLFMNERSGWEEMTKLNNSHKSTEPRAILPDVLCNITKKMKLSFELLYNFYEIGTRDGFTKRKNTVNRESRKHLGKVNGDVYTEKCCQTSEGPHMWRISQPVRWDLDRESKADKRPMTVAKGDKMKV